MTAHLDLLVRRPLRPASTEDVAALTSWAKALTACAKASGLLDKSLAIECDIDASQLSKILGGQLGIMPDKLFRLMDACGSELPLLWLMHQRGYDIEALRQRETELQRQLREANERAESAESKLATITDFMRKARGA